MGDLKLKLRQINSGDSTLGLKIKAEISKFLVQEKFNDFILRFVDLGYIDINRKTMKIFFVVRASYIEDSYDRAYLAYMLRPILDIDKGFSYRSNNLTIENINNDNMPKLTERAVKSAILNAFVSFEDVENLKIEQAKINSKDITRQGVVLAYKIEFKNPLFT